MIGLNLWRFAYQAVIAGLLVATPIGQAFAQALQVSPVIIEMLPDKRSAALEITNTSTSPVDVQVRPYDWHQVDGRDELVDSTTLRISPSIVEIGAGKTQTIRLLAPTSPRTSEVDWRVLVDELPQGPGGTGMRIKLRMYMPDFGYATKSAATDIRWRLTGRRLEASNIGLRHARLNELFLRHANGSSTPLALEERPYMLPGTSRHWDLATSAVPGVTVVGRDGSTAFSAQIAVELAR